jgi:hypothetical protein
LGQWTLSVIDTTDSTMSGKALIMVLPPPRVMPSITTDKKS